jgi:hypothetical protein
MRAAISPEMMKPRVRVVPNIGPGQVHRTNNADDSGTRHGEALHRC